MRKQLHTFPVRAMLAAGGMGFVIAFFASMAGGNLFITSAKRGIVGFIVFFIAYWILQLLFPAIIQGEPDMRSDQDSEPTGTAGTNFDVSLPAEHFDTPPSPGDFQPWIIPGRKDSESEQIENLVQAVRTMKE